MKTRLQEGWRCGKGRLRMGNCVFSGVCWLSKEPLPPCVDSAAQRSVELESSGTFAVPSLWVSQCCER